MVNTLYRIGPTMKAEEPELSGSAIIMRKHLDAYRAGRPANEVRP